MAFHRIESWGNLGWTAEHRHFSYQRRYIRTISVRLAEGIVFGFAGIEVKIMVILVRVGILDRQVSESVCSHQSYTYHYVHP